LRQAVIFAAVFVGARVVYYALFAGAGYGGVTLLALPLVALPAPFTGVQLLGPVTSGGLASAALSAVPFAAAILFFGVLNALFDVRPWLAAGARRGPARSLLRALVIAWQTVPALGAAVRRARRAARLRGERPGAAVLVPVLEGTIERAVALAASLELRGFAASARVGGDCERPVEVADAVLARPGWSLSIPALSLAPATLTVLSGATGSGKSSVLDALSGLFQHADGGSQTGIVLVGGADRAVVPPRETAGFVAAVAQRVRLGFVGETVAEEIGFALTLRGVAPVIVAARVREVAVRLAIAHLVERPITALSAGEAELVALAAAMVENPTLLLVDEPLAELDAAARPRVVAALAALAHEAGVCVVVAEHRVAWFAEVADGWLEIADGRLRRADAAGVAALPASARPGPPALSAPPAPPLPAVQPGPPFRERDPLSGNRIRFPDSGSGSPTPGPVVAELRGLSVRHEGRLVVDRASLALRAGELVALTGANGAGKSSLLHAFALPSESGRVIVGGADVRGMSRRRRRSAVALVPEEFEDLFVTDSVAAECRRADRHARARTGRRPTRTQRHSHGRPTPTAVTHGCRTTALTSTVLPTLERFAALLGLDPQGAELRRLADTHPRDLSGGQRVCLAIALQLAGDPAVLLVDEPVRGLDGRARAELAAALGRAADAGAAVLFATHERDFAAELADRVLRLTAGRLTSEAGHEDQNELANAAAADRAVDAVGPGTETGAETATGSAATPGAGA